MACAEAALVLNALAVLLIWVCYNTTFLVAFFNVYKKGLACMCCPAEICSRATPWR
ncbi:uncharacterized protein K460DRAFT_363661 [Cucurbitaria berberidis CBS 394.84]|uniref:Uncharacterized protein n=1 Tax=Cucurbitaria berberidis CBS 394.84 TaxID=1168544 RepID=A0A9P4GJU5_9PLEO|nr:uncharacterized protein K460DRAFT_363661 [Cucurbitaria berberidis CBS 394.84]KAF1847593.1 hypothetical protein K460DRAFT_363661 [Cucurbitaria berberidis CBS 394.84]